MAELDERTKTEFCRCVLENDAAGVRTLLRATPDPGAWINAPWFSFDSPAVVHAANAASTDLIDALLESGADINSRSQWWAGSFGVLDTCSEERGRYLISRGARLDANSAAHLGMLPELQAILEATPKEAKRRGGDGQTPLHVAANAEVVNLLVERGAELDLRDIDHGSTPAQYAVGERKDACRRLIELGAEPDIFIAAYLGDAELVRRVLASDPRSAGAQIGEGQFVSNGSEGGHIYLYRLGSVARPLTVAAESGGAEAMRLLFEMSPMEERFVFHCMNADRAAAKAMTVEHPGLVTALTGRQAAAVADAAWARKLAAMQLMIDLGFPVDARGDEESTALNRAAVRGYADAAEIALRAGASVDARNKYGGDALRACLWGSENFRDPAGDYPATAKLILNAGATMPEHAYGSPEVVTVLRAAGVPVSAETSLVAPRSHGRTARRSDG